MGPFERLRKLRSHERAVFDTRQRNFCRLGGDYFGNGRLLLLRKCWPGCSSDDDSQQKRSCNDGLGRIYIHCHSPQWRSAITSLVRTDSAAGLRTLHHGCSARHVKRSDCNGWDAKVPPIAGGSGYFPSLSSSELTFEKRVLTAGADFPFRPSQRILL